MLSKGTELFEFEGELFKLKKRFINEEFNEECWHKLMHEGDQLLKKYRGKEDIEDYCFLSFAAFIDFLDKRENKRKGLKGYK